MPDVEKQITVNIAISINYAEEFNHKNVCLEWVSVFPFLEIQRKFCFIHMIFHVFYILFKHMNQGFLNQ